MRAFLHAIVAAMVLVAAPAAGNEEIARLLAQGKAQEAQQRWNMAAATYHDLLDKDPENATAYHRLGRVRERLGALDGALDAYEKALALDPELGEARSALEGYWVYQGLMHRQQTRPAEAVAAFQKAITYKPDSASAHLELGRTLEGTGQLAEAAAAYEQAGALDAEGVAAPARLGAVRARQGQHQQAVTAYQEAARRNPRDPEVHHGLGTAYAALGRRDEAVEALGQAVRYYVYEGREDKAIEAENLEQELLGEAPVKAAPAKPGGDAPSGP